MPRGRPKKITIQKQDSESYFDKVSQEVSSNQSKVSLVLGALIVLVVGILVFNYFNKGKPSLGPAQNTEQQQQPTQSPDVTPDNLPGKYTVKEGDTLFDIATKYYNDGYKYSEIAKANNLSDPNILEKGQVLDIPKLEVMTTPQPSPTEMTTSAPSTSPTSDQPSTQITPGSKGAPDITMNQWGPPITSSTYTVVEGDWLSKIAGRAYGDIMAYSKIAEANNISNPDLIEPGMVLKIPRQ